MALADSELKDEIVAQLERKGFVTTGQFAKSADLAEAVAIAVVKIMTRDAEVVVTSGSSAGTYKIS
ncbi:MAG: hypothetical protein ACRC0U_06870 [Vibrio sp.]